MTCLAWVLKWNVFLFVFIRSTPFSFALYVTFCKVKLLKKETGYSSSSLAKHFSPELCYWCWCGVCSNTIGQWLIKNTYRKIKDIGTFFSYFVDVCSFSVPASSSKYIIIKYTRVKGNTKMSRVNSIKNGDGDNPFVILNRYQHPSPHKLCIASI